MGWSDLKRLNSELLAIVDKFSLLDKTNRKCRVELAKYKDNFEVIQTGLGAFNALILSDTSKAKEYEAEVKKLNTQVRVVHKLGCDFQSAAFSQSAIIPKDKFARLVHWYGQNWRLLYRGSRDGHTALAFHNKCDGMGPTITVISRAGSTAVFGGYTKESWHSLGQFVNDPSASLFSLTNPLGIAPVKFEVSSPGNAIYCSANYGPTFGGGHDMCLNGPDVSFIPNDYRDTT